MYEPKAYKPSAKLLGKDGNAFNLIALTRRALIKAGQADKATQFVNLAMDAGSYDELLMLIQRYVIIE